MKKALFLVTAPVLLALFSLGTPAQEQPPTKAVSAQKAKAEAASPCPRLEIQSPGSRIVRDGQPVRVVANIAGGDPKVTPTLVWNVSAGTIRDGQGTPRIEIDSTGAGAYREIVADLWVGGYAPECGSQQATVTVNVVGPASLVDEFGELAADKENERIAYLATALARTNDNVYVIAYAGRGNVRGYAAEALRRITDEFVKGGIPARRIAAINGGFREQPAYELWIVPQGAEAPRPTPTVDRKEIVYPKPPPRKRSGTRRP